MILQRIAMGSPCEKTFEAQNCGRKCLRENPEKFDKFMSDVALKIDSGYYKKKLIVKNATEVKQMIHTQIYELIEILKEREKQLYLNVDEECIDQIAQVDINLSKLSGHCCNTYNYNDNICDPNPIYDKNPSCFSMMKLDFKSDMKTVKSRLRTFGNLSLHYSNGFENVLPGSASFSAEPKEEVSSDYAKWQQMRERMNCFFRSGANDDLVKRINQEHTSDFSGDDDDLYSTDYREFERDNPLVEDDIEIISENEVSEIPSHSPEFPPKHTSRKKLFSGKRSLPVLPCTIFRKNSKDDKMEIEKRSLPVIPFSIFQMKVEKDGNVKVEKQNNTELEKGNNLPCSSSIICNPESNTKILTPSDKNENSVECCILTEAKKNEVPSAALATSLFAQFYNNKEEWLASKNDSGKGLSTEPAIEKGFCSKDGSGKFQHSEKKLSQWLPPKENPENSSFWLSENPHQCSAKI